MGAQRAEDQLGGRPAEGALHQVVQQLTLRVCLGCASGIDMGPRRFVARDESLVRHDLHQLQSRGVSGLASTSEGFVYLTDRGWSAFP